MLLHSTYLALLPLLFTCNSCLQLNTNKSQSSNESGLLSELWTSLTTVGKAPACPGECVHAITSIFCDHVLEEISCGDAFHRCCVTQHVSHATPVETSPLLDKPSTEPPITTTEAFSIIYNNHNTNKSPSTEWFTINSVNQFSTTPSTDESLHYANGFVLPSSESPDILFHSPCPVQCSKREEDTLCLKPLLNTKCQNNGEECCLESESNMDTKTKNFIKLVQQSVALNETKNIGTELSGFSTVSTTTSSSLPACSGTCVVQLFSILCDEIDTNQYCSNGGSCCVNRDLTTTAPPIVSCDGHCIPVILSGMCNKPFELILKTIECGTGTICCTRSTVSDGNDQMPDIENEPNSGMGVGAMASQYPISMPRPSQPIPPMQLIGSGLPSKGTKPRPFEPNFYQPIPDLPHHQNPLIVDVPNNVHFKPTENEQFVSDDKLQENSNKMFQCPGNCLNTMFKFTCFGSSLIYANFKCPKGQICCAPVSEIEKFELFLQSQVQAIPPQNNPNQINNFPSVVEGPRNNVADRHVCGVKGPHKQVRVVGGTDSYPGEWCWQVALLNRHNQYFCAGALIGKQWVLTSAHCVTNLVDKNEPFFVRVGEYDLTRNSRLAQAQNVIATFIHHNHKKTSLDNDIALLKLQSPVELNSNTCLVCLPTRNIKRQAAKRCVVTGYGYRHKTGSSYALRVHDALIQIVNDQECTNKITSVLDKPFILPANSFCAGGEGKDACQGDGGSGLVCESDGFYELTGLVSWGIGCEGKVPGVYVKVASFVGWINQIVSTNAK